MEVSLPPELEHFVQERVATGRSRSAGEVVEAALWLLQERDREEETKLAALRADIEEGIASIERGEGVDGEDFFATLRAHRPLPGDP